MKEYLPDIQSCPENPSKVSIRLDLTDYIQLLLEQPRQELLKSPDFKAEREKLAALLSGFGADIFLQDFQQAVVDAVSALLPLSEEAKPESHALVCLKQYFIELYKNSVDAFIHKATRDGKNYGSLEFTVELQLADELKTSTVPTTPDTIATGIHQRLKIMITDNGCGFPDAYLEKFNHPERSRSSNRILGTEKAHYNFGGACLGMAGLCDLFLRGRGKDLGSGKSARLYRVTSRACSIRIANSPDGAIIELNAPLQGFRDVREMDGYTDEIAALCQANFFGKKPRPESTGPTLGSPSLSALATKRAHTA